MRIPRRIISACLAFAACHGDRAARGNDTAETNTPPRLTRSNQRAAISGWEDAAGPWFMVPAGSGLQAYVILPALTPDVALDTMRLDVASIQRERPELFDHGIRAGDAEVAMASVDSASDCPVWPTIQLRTNTMPWNVAFQPGRTRVFPQDTLAGLSARDSLRLSIEIARLASAVPGDTNTLFLGRPFVVRQAVRAGADEDTVLVAEVTRTVNQEATPWQEHLLIFAEWNRAARIWSTVFTERSIALEESAETSDVLAIFRAVTRPEALFVLVSRDFGEGGAFALFEREVSGLWRLRWTSPFAGC